jgi:UDP-N-acetylglucosamine--N-acetylmuramyl-(pentapeptide) pyrophosphoryl-undecaprenol N-acetylglucosamine transferase
VKKPCILVPSPNVAEDHQTKNAMALVEKDAALMIKDAAAVQVLVPAALKLLQDNQRQEIFKENIGRLAKPNAAKEIAATVLEIVKENNLKF